MNGNAAVLVGGPGLFGLAAGLRPTPGTHKDRGRAVFPAAKATGRPGTASGPADSVSNPTPHHTSSGADIPADVTWCAEPERSRSLTLGRLQSSGAPNGVHSGPGDSRTREVLTLRKDGQASRVIGSAPPPLQLRAPSLTPRQAQCLLMAAQGFGYREIGHVLGIAARTVRGHMLASAARLGATSLVNAVWTARRQLEAGT